ncbi:hypothetical protein BCR43DRAFT_483613 [Syncephalastrum racemosum]|uniref:C2H2-type domain-containing protein n=1 Tax=Syncephalastrum racemosum TaxID=13706 RepID=A0A1X2HVL3_SYNRA|nr:hypothetical protein BCR43DRAFT_483613 [Syncephalastrum racemosum]
MYTAFLPEAPHNVMPLAFDFIHHDYQHATGHDSSATSASSIGSASCLASSTSSFSASPPFSPLPLTDYSSSSSPESYYMYPTSTSATTTSTNNMSYTPLSPSDSTYSAPWPQTALLEPAQPHSHHHQHPHGIATPPGLGHLQPQEQDLRVELRPYLCPRCSRAFARKHDLHRHIRVHTGDKPYACVSCKKAFARTDALKRHLRIEQSCRESPEVQAMKCAGKRRYRNL